MKMHSLALLGLLMLPLVGCESEAVRDLPARLDELSRKNDQLEERVAKLERAAPTPAPRAEQADDDRLERLRAGQRMIEQNQKMLCDATQEC